LLQKESKGMVDRTEEITVWRIIKRGLREKIED
jgi:hypothetical protein